MIKIKTGFTLIELLAVIVIVAIIALISTPLILSVIEDARKGAFKASAYGIVDAAAFKRANMKLANDTYKNTDILLVFTESGQVAYYDSNNNFIIEPGVDDSIAGFKLELKGSTPISGRVFLDASSGTAISITDGTYVINKKTSEETVTIVTLPSDGSQTAADYEIPEVMDYTAPTNFTFVGGVLTSYNQITGGNEVVIPATDANGTPITTISSGAFGMDDNVTSIDLRGMKYLTTIEDDVFDMNMNLTTLKLDGLEELVTIGSSQMASAYSLNTLELKNLPNLVNLPLSIIIDADITTLVFENLPSLITIPGNTFSYGNLTTLTFKNVPNLTSIGDQAFNAGGYGDLTNLDLSELSSLASIGAYAFYSNPLTSINLSNTSITTIGNCAFCTGGGVNNTITSIQLPASFIPVNLTSWNGIGLPNNTCELPNCTG